MLVRLVPIILRKILVEALILLGIGVLRIVLIIIVRTNLIARVSQIQGHEIRVVLYARLDDDDCRLYEADYEVYILMRLPLISQCFISAPDA